jgi:cytochrome P450
MPFFLAALLRPEIQAMAQRELDAVTMRERLPTLEDRPRLPFVDAICKEVRRWRPVVPLGELLLSLTPSRRSMTIHRPTPRNGKG